MPIFGLGGKKSETAKAPRRVLAEGDRVAAKLIQAADAQDWSGIHSTLTGYQGRDLSALTSTLSTHEPTREWLRKVADENPEDFISRLLLGSCAIEDGWKIRTGAFAQHVSREQFTAFHDELKQAEEYLYQAAELDPEAAAPWHFLLMSGRGLQVGIDALERRFEAATKRCPDHFGAHSQMLQCLCKKWSGSHERMHAFAEEAIRGPHWATLAPLVVWAHLERFLDLGGGEAGKAYLAQPNVLAEIQEAADLTLWQPDYADARAPYALANLFAMAFSLARDWEQALPAFEATDWVVTRRPWEYLNGRDQKAPYAKFRHFATKLG
jgi:hypothetical protein